MKINLIIGSFYPAVIYGGPIFSTMHTSKALGELGHKVYVSTTDANGYENLDVETNKFLYFAKNVYVKYYSGANRAGFSIRYMLGLWNDIRNSDVVFLQSVFSSYVPVSLMYSILLKKKVLLSPRGSLGEWCMKDRRFLLKKIWLCLMLTPFKKIITWHATSNQEKDEIGSFFNSPRIEIIPNGVDLTEFKSSDTIDKVQFMRQFTNSSFSPSHIIISMGRLTKKKGFDILIVSFATIANEFPYAVLLIAGPDGGADKELNALILRLNLDRKSVV